jgi:hypothetical protein
MSKVFLALLLNIVSINVMAEWVKIENSADFDVYIDNRSIKESDDTLQLWVLYDFNSVQGSDDRRYLSFKSLNQYKCQTKTTKMLVSTTYEGHATTGRVVDTFNGSAKKLPIPDQSIAESLWRLVCNK